MALELGKTYYLKNVAVNKYLNVYGNETISLGRNVNLYTKEDCNAQKWVIDRKNSNDFGVYVMSKLNTGYTLNIYEEDSNNCTVYPYYYNGVYNVADAMVDFLTVDASQNLYRIKLVNHNKYLSLHYVSDLNVYWSSNINDYTLWQLEEVTVPTGNISINLRNKISSYNQRTDSKYEFACAGVCGCMAINTHPDAVPENYLIPQANWYAIASLVGKTADPQDDTSLINVLNLLQQGYPVMVRTRTKETSQYGQHWVIIYGYSGSATNVTASGFMCIDPYGANTTDTFGKDCALVDSNHFVAVTRRVHFK